MTQRLPTPGSDTGQWGYILNGFLGVAHDANGNLLGSAISGAGGEITANKGVASGYAPLSNSGLVPTANLGNGTAGSSNYLRGDGTWVVPPTGVALDTTAGDIQPLGTQAAGSAGKAADAGHVHAMPTAGQVGALSTSNNLSDVADAGSSRSNLHVPVLTPAACVVTTNVSALSGLNTYDGYTLASGDFVLLVAQTTSSQNGLWLPASGSWTRPTEFATGAVIKGRSCRILNGTSYGGTDWTLEAPTAGITVDASSQTWKETFDGRYATTNAVRSATIVVAAADSSARAKGAADFVCTGTNTTGGDDATINAAIAALPGGSGSYAVNGRLLLMEGNYYLSGSIISDLDDMMLEGEGHGQTTMLHYVAGTQRQAAIIMGNTRTSIYQAVKNVCVQSGDTSGNVVTGSGIIFRSSVGHLENITVLNTERDGVRVEALQVLTAGATGTISTTVSTTPSIFTQETWILSSTSSLTTGMATVSTGGTVNDSTLEIIQINTVLNSTQLTVTRGAWGSPIQTHASGQILQMFTYTNIFEVDARNIKIISPNIDGFVVDPSVLNSEFTRVHIQGGKNLGTPRGRHGIYDKGGNNKFLLCHPYYNVSDGFHGDGYYLANDGIVIMGGEYENNSGTGISVAHSTNSGMDISGAFLYGNTSNDIAMTGCNGWTVRNCLMSSSTKHIYANGLRWLIQGNKIINGNTFAIDVEGTSTAQGRICNNTIIGIGSSTNSVNLAQGNDISVHDNTLDRPVIETSGVDNNRVYHNDFLTTNGTSGAAVTLVGTHSERWENRNVDDFIKPTTATYTAFARDRILADLAAVGGNQTITTPPSGTSANYFEIIRIDTGANTLTISAASGLTVNGGATMTIAAAASSTSPTVRRFGLYGTNWTAFD